MGDYLAPDTGGGYGNDDGRGGSGWLRGLHQRTRTPTAHPDGVAAYDGNDSDGNTTAGFQDNAYGQKQEQAWERLDRERDQKAHYRPDEYRDHQSTAGSPFGSPSRQKKSGHLTFPQRVSSLLNLSAIGGGGGNERKSKILSPFKPFVPSGIDPRTPGENPWQIPAVASAPGPTYPTSRRKKSLFFGNADRDANGDGDDEEAFGYRRFPKVEESAPTVGAWHNPNLMQVVESLQAAMMNKRDPMEHIPVVYNSYVLMLIEAFGKLTTQLQCSDSQIRELKELREKELEEFRGMSEEWIQRENGYKAEIKRLELVLAKESRDGVASVAMARHHSLVDRSGSKRFQARLKRMSAAEHEDMKDQPVKEDVETQSIAETSTCYRNINEVPRSINVDKDVIASRLVEKLERDDKARKESEAIAVRHNRNADDFTQGYQKQPLQQSAHERSRDAKAHRHIPKIKGPKDGTTANRADDGLTVEREAYRSASTAHDAATNNPTGAGLSAQERSPTGFSGGPKLRRETLGASRPNLESHNVTRGAGRRYSFSHGDDEVLPVTPLAASFEEAESRYVTGVPTGYFSSGRPHGASGMSDNFSHPAELPLSASSSSRGSVVWLGEGSNATLVGPEQHVHPSSHSGDVSDDVRKASLIPQRSASLYSPQQVFSYDQVSNLSGVYSPSGIAPAPASHNGRGEAQSSYASPTIRTVLDVEVETSQMSQALPTGGRSASRQPSLAPSNDVPSYSSEATSHAARIAATRATKRDGQWS